MNFYTNFIADGNSFLIRYVKNGVHKKRRLEPGVSLYMKDDKPDTPYKTLDGDPLKEISFPNIISAKAHIKNMRDSGSQVFGFPRFGYDFINTLYPGDGVEYDFDQLNVLYLDIETESENGFPNIEEANEKINAITLGFNDHYYSLGLESIRRDVLDEDCSYTAFDTEKDMVRRFIELWRKFDPDIITGYYIDFFDIPYLINRISYLFGMNTANLLSPWKIVEHREVYKMGKTQFLYDIKGVSSLDYLDLYKKYTYSVQESYKLDYISYIELGEKKLDYSEFGNLHTLYKEDYSKYIEYNIKDVKLVRRLEQKKKFIELACQIAYSAKVNFEDVFMNTRLWDVIIANHLKNNKNVIVPSINQRGEDSGYEGAFVKEARPGYYNWVCSFDLTSLYPSLIIQYNISPETIRHNKSHLVADDIINQTETYQDEITFAKKNNYALAANGAMFSRDNIGFLPELMIKQFDERKEAKNKKLHYENEIEKIDKILEARKDEAQ